MSVLFLRERSGTEVRIRLTGEGLRDKRCDRFWEEQAGAEGTEAISAVPACFGRMTDMIEVGLSSCNCLRIEGIRRLENAVHHILLKDTKATNHAGCQLRVKIIAKQDVGKLILQMCKDLHARVSRGLMLPRLPHLLN